MEKILFVSDLDGTLLNNRAEISEYTAEKLNSLIAGGIHFTFATARTIYSAKLITQGLDIRVPCILNNGASIYDINSGIYLKNRYILQEKAEKILSAFFSNNVHCFVYKFIDNVLVTCYDQIASDIMNEYANERQTHYKKPLIQCDNLVEAVDGTVIYINAMGSYEMLLPVKNEVERIGGVDFVFYRDTYTDCWFLEIFSREASKASGIQFLREKYGFTKIVAFGDNLNDMSMFREADIKVAVGNAREELKSEADFIADTNENNGVVDWICKNFT